MIKLLIKLKCILKVLDKYNGSDSNIIIPNGVHILGERVYEGCDFITSISLSDTVFEINNKIHKMHIVQ